MADETSRSWLLLQIVVVATVSAVAAALLQKWITGDVNPAVTGGVVGGVTAATASLGRRG